MSLNTEYDRLLSEVKSVNRNFRTTFSTSPTIAELSEIIGTSEEKILESMEFGHITNLYVC